MFGGWAEMAAENKYGQPTNRSALPRSVFEAEKGIPVDTTVRLLGQDLSR